MEYIILQVKVVTSWKSSINYNDGSFEISQVISSFRSDLEDDTSEGYLSLAIF